MEIFIVEVNRVIEGEEVDYDTQAFYTEEKAKEALKTLVDDEKPYCEKSEWEIEADDDDYFLAYGHGEYVMNHIEAAVRLLEVK